ncbi:MAG: isocitrate lyase [Rhodothalassiaceae bacterium]
MTSFHDLVPTPHANRFDGINRMHSAADVERLRGSVTIRHTLAERGANRLWGALKTEAYVNSLGAVTGNQAVQMARAGLQAIYLSGWQVAADANTASQTYPDQSLYPANAGPELAKRINRALHRADQIECAEGNVTRDWYLPIVADAEAGFGGPLNCYEIMKAYIEAGAAGVHFEDQLASEKKCGHLGRKVLIPTKPHERNLNAARLAADVMGTPTLIMARTDAQSARLITSDVDERDHKYIDFEAGRTPEGFYRIKEGMGVEHCIDRGLAFADKADLIWWETSTPNLEDAKRFAEAIHKEFPGKMLSYNCSPSFNWKKNLDEATIAKFQRELGAMGYKFQFVTLAGFHALNYSMFELARGYASEGMAAYSRLQTAEFDAEENGYTATRHQREAGTGYFDLVALTLSGGQSSTTAMGESTETAQFKEPALEAAE